jgi:integrase
MGRKAKGNDLPCWYPFWKEGSWHYDFRVEGKRFRRSSGVCDPEAIEIAIAVAKGLHDAAWDRALSPFPTFAEAAHLYLADIGQNRRHVRRLIGYFGPDIRIDDIDAFMIKQCKVALFKPTWTSQNTAQRQVVTPLKAVLGYALGTRPEALEDGRRTRVLNPEECERLIAKAKSPPEGVRDPELRLLKMIAFLLGSGATPGEMFCVRASDVNRATGEVFIRGEEPGGGKTRYRSRMVRLPKRAWELIGPLPTKGRVFRTTTGKEVVPDGERGSTSIRQFHKLCAAAGIASEAGEDPVVFYTLRHTWATFFSAQVGDQDLLIDRGGWARADMARHYRKQAPRDLAERLLAHGWNYRT